MKHIGEFLDEAMQEVLINANQSGIIRQIESERFMTDIQIIVGYWCLASVAFGVWICPRLMRKAPGGKE